MKKIIRAVLACALFLVATAQDVNAQFPKIKTPKVEVPKIKTPKVELPTDSDNNKGSSKTSSKTDVKIGSKSSGSFDNVTEDPSANSHRRNCDEKLDFIIAEYAKPARNYSEIFKQEESINKAYEFVKKLEPNVDGSRFEAKHNPIKERVAADLVSYNRAKELEKEFSNNYSYEKEYKEYTFEKYQSNLCYCKYYYNKTASKYSEYQPLKTEYDALLVKLAGYSHEDTKIIFERVASCHTNGNTYATWVGNAKIQELEAFATKNEANEPKDVIKKANEYITVSDMLAADPSFPITTAAKTALASGKASAEKIKNSADTYISSGRYQAHLDKLYQEKIAKVFMPKSTVKNASLEQSAIAYIKGEDVGTPSRAVTIHADHKVVKLDNGIPKYQFKEIVVATKKDGKCFKVSVYASYTYKGGGTYATAPTWGYDKPEEMACENLNK